MTAYTVQETVLYHLEAASEADAIQHVIEDGDRDQHCFREVSDRQAWERDPYEVYGTPEHEALLIEEERGT